MLAADATNPEAIDAVFRAKGRSETNPIHVAVATIEMIERCVDLPHAARRVCVQLLPGPITVIGRNRDVVPESLVAQTRTLGVRMPDNPATLQVLRALDRPVTATSLNRSGTPPTHDPVAGSSNLESAGIGRVHVVRDPQSLTYSSPSTLVTFVTDPWEILRPGPVGVSDIEEATRAFTQDDLADWT